VKALIEKQTNKKIKHLKNNNGLKFCSCEFDEFYKNEKIIKYCNVRNTPQWNRVACCMLSQDGLLKYF